MLFDEGGRSLGSRCPLAGVIGREQAENAIEPLEIALLDGCLLRGGVATLRSVGDALADDLTHGRPGALGVAPGYGIGNGTMGRD